MLITRGCFPLLKTIDLKIPSPGLYMILIQLNSPASFNAVLPLLCQECKFQYLQWPSIGIARNAKNESDGM